MKIRYQCVIQCNAWDHFASDSKGVLWEREFNVFVGGCCSYSNKYTLILVFFFSPFYTIFPKIIFTHLEQHPYPSLWVTIQIHQRVDIIHTILKIRLLERCFRTFIKNVLFSSSTDMKSNIMRSTHRKGSSTLRFTCRKRRRKNSSQMGIW